MSFIKGIHNLSFQRYSTQLTHETSIRDPNALEDEVYLGRGAYADGESTNPMQVGEVPRMEILCERSVPIRVGEIIKITNKGEEGELGNFKVVAKDHGKLFGKVSQVQRIYVIEHIFDLIAVS